MLGTQLTQEAASDRAVPAPAVASSSIAPRIGLEQYYREAGPDYAAWSPEFNMHFGYFRAGANPLNREAMLEQMNAEVLARLHLHGIDTPHLLDLGCGLGATLRSLARCLPGAKLFGITRVPWQVEQARARNEGAGFGNRIHVIEGDYEACDVPSRSYDGVYALESSCHAHGSDKRRLLEEAHRVLRPGGRLVVADGFLAGDFVSTVQQHIYRKLCECWVIEELGKLHRFTSRMLRLGFKEITVERLQMRVAPSVMHIPWVTLKFLLTEVVFGKRAMTPARWNNIIAPMLLPLVSEPLGPMTYCMISATKA